MTYDRWEVTDEWGHLINDGQLMRNDRWWNMTTAEDILQQITDNNRWGHMMKYDRWL